MSGTCGGPPGGRPAVSRPVSLRSLTTRSSDLIVHLINNLRSMASSDAIVRSQAAEVICELSRHNVVSNTRCVDVSNNFN